MTLTHRTVVRSLVAITILMNGCARKERLIGSTLDNWIQRGGRAEYRLDGETIVGETRPNQPNSFLCTRADYGDFRLELDFLVDPRLNSGVQIRSQSRRDYKDGAVHGYQVEIDPSARAWSGGIYDESRRGWLAPLDKNPVAQRAFKQGEWNHLAIEARGDRIRTWLNGVPAADLRDSMTLSGFIALQVHGGAEKETMQVKWKNIEVTRLD